MKINIEAISEEITTIVSADADVRFNLIREKIGDSVPGLAKFQVLILGSKKDDKTNLVGLPGITGKLNKHIVKIADFWAGTTAG